LINSKLPENTFNSWIQDSEGNIPNWVGKFYRVSALVVLLNSLMMILSPIWSGRMEENLEILGNILSMLIWIYAAFPISRVIRSVGDSSASSKSGMIDFIFKDLAIANI